MGGEGGGGGGARGEARVRARRTERSALRVGGRVGALLASPRRMVVVCAPRGGFLGAGFFMPANKKVEIVCFAYFFVMLNQVRVPCGYDCGA